MWCILTPDVYFLPVQPPSLEPIAPSDSLHEHETGEEEAESVLAVLQVKSIPHVL